MITITLRRLDYIDTAICSPYSAKDDVKGLVGARWSKDLRAWIIPTDTAVLARTELSGRGYKVEMIGFSALIAPQINEPWEALFTAVPVALRTKTYYAIAKVLHPDAGGDLEAMQALTRAYSKIGA